MLNTPQSPVSTRPWAWSRGVTCPRQTNQQEGLAHSIPNPTLTSSPVGAQPPRHGPGSGAADHRVHRFRHGHLGLHPLRRLRHQRRPPRRRRARPRSLLLRRHPPARQFPRVPPQRRHGDARRPIGVGRVLLQRGRHQRGLPRDQRVLRRHGHRRGRNRG